MSNVRQVKRKASPKAKSPLKHPPFPLPPLEPIVIKEGAKIDPTKH